MRPVIGVTGNSRRHSPSWWCIRIALWLCGARPHRISVVSPDIPHNLDGIVISGGDDVHPALYESHLTSTAIDAEDYDVERDQLEITCIEYARHHRLPLLGICRGAQLLNVVRGGNLHRDVNPMRVRTSKRAHLAPRKTIRLDTSSRLAWITGRANLKVNSLHDQAINRLGEGLTCVGRDLDRIIQAVESADDMLGVQWHPEYLFILPTQLKIFRWLVLKSRERHNA